MFSKIALGAALVIGSVSGAFAWNNIGEIETPRAQMSVGHDAFAAGARQVVAPQTNSTFDRAGNVSAY
jgi:hypothetical protein